MCKIFQIVALCLSLTSCASLSLSVAFAPNSSKTQLYVGSAVLMGLGLLTYHNLTAAPVIPLGTKVQVREACEKIPFP